MIAADFLGESFFRELEIGPVLLNVVLVLLLSQVLSWHYTRFAQVLSSKRRFARLLPFLATTTLLVISVVKTSLALSLGLVGALSIIRFRTPIKEPEELAYLFLAIALGIGLGADQRIATCLIFACILLYLGISQVLRGQKSELRTVLQVTAPMLGEGTPAGDDELRALLPAVEASCTRVDLRRVDRHEETFNASLLVEMGSADDLAELLAAIQSAIPGASVSLIERDALA
jgi:hypothetical protein